VDLQLSHDFLGYLTERIVGALHVDVFQGDEQIAHSSSRIEVLAFDEWNGLQSLPEIIAAFVTPNYPAIDTLLSEAANILREWTGDSSLAGYQSRDSQRVFHTTGAIYTALQRRKITYTNPPASFEERGQKIRLPDRILDNQLGTCLDLTVLAASCLEQIGLYPLIVMTNGHAFVGAWLEDDCFADVATDDVLRLRKRVELKEICVFETTLVTATDNIPFEQAVIAGQRNLDDENAFRCVIDICRARKCRIRPLPSRNSTGGITELKPSSTNEKDDRPDASSVLPTFEHINITNEGTAVVEETPETRLDRWKRKLLDMTMRNKLLNFRESKKTLPMLCPDPGSFEDALADGAPFKMYPRLADLGEVDPRNADVHRNRTGQDALDEQLREELKAHRLHVDLTDTEFNRRMLEVYREAKLSIEENGTNTLYLALEFLAWYESTSSEKRRLAPIILIPLAIDRQSVMDGFSISLDDEPIINITLLEMLAKDFDLVIPNTDHIPSNEQGIDVKGILNSFRKSVKTIDRWEVIESVYIGHFSFTKFLMWRDLEVRADELQRSKVVDHLVNTPNQPYQDRDGFPDADYLDVTHSPGETFCPLSYDSSQLAAIYAAAAGKSFVLHGPPGTGKSQTITNMIAHSLTTGKTVLFVSEKRAALEVVFRQLDKCGLSPFCLELHSNKSSKQAVLTQLKSSLDYYGSVPSDSWLHEATRLASARSDLNRYVTALHSIRETGESIFQGVSRLIGLCGAKSVRLNLLATRDLDREQLDRLRNSVAQLAVAASAIEHPSTNAWRTTDYRDWSISLERSIADVLQQTSRHCEALDAAAQSASMLLCLPTCSCSRQQYDNAALAAANLLELLPQIPPVFLRATDYCQLTNTIREWTSIGRKRDQLRVDVYAHFSERVLIIDLPILRQQIAKATSSWLTPALVAKQDSTSNEDWIPWVEREVSNVIAELSKTTISLQENTKEVTPLIGIIANSLTKSGYVLLDQLCEVLLQVPPALPIALLNEEDWDAVRLTIQSWIEHGRRRDALRGTLYKGYTEQFVKLNLDDLRQKLVAANASWFVPRTFGHLAVRKAMKGVCRAGVASTAETLLTDIEQAIALRTEDSILEYASEQATTLLGLHWKNGEADWEFIEQLVEWCGSLRKVVAMASNSDTQQAVLLRAHLATFLRENRDRCMPDGDIGALFQAMRDANTNFAGAYSNLKTLFTIELSYLWGQERNMRIEDIIDSLQEWQKQIAALHIIQKIIHVGALPTVENLVRNLALASDLVATEQRIALISPHAADMLGEDWRDGEAHWSTIDGILEHGQCLRDDARRLTASIPEHAQKLQNHWADIAENEKAGLSKNGCLRIQLSAFQQSYTACIKSLEALEDMFSQHPLRREDRPWEIKPLDAFDEKLSLDAVTVRGESYAPGFLDTVTERLQIWINNIHTFRAWCYWRSIRHKAVNLGLQALVIAFEDQQITPSDFLNTFNRGYYEEWVEKVTSGDQELNKFFSREFERKIEQFREIDERYMKLTRAEICARIAARLPNRDSTGRPNSEPGILRRQIKLQRRHMSVRTLFQKIPTLMPRLKPCLLMSPISVAQYLDPAYPKFDLVVFDEASQISVWDAIGAIARGKEAVIVGDPKQLPPTNFFSRVDDDNDTDIEEGMVEDLDSILDDCIAAQLPEQYLRWHYRSRHESLITFSNYNYYENRMLTFPSPYQHMGVSLRHVSGTYDIGKSRTNHAEAEAIVAEVVNRLCDPNLSIHTIGVVTFSLAQQLLIDNLLEKARSQYPEIDSFFGSGVMKQLFVKNLENVQGDERDVILLSVCYGPDAQGRVAMNFGPLNRDGGERRLNVAITRARHEMIIFSTLRSEQIDLAKTRARGMADLKCFLEYAERGVIAIAERQTTDPNADCESPFEEQVCSALRDRGYVVHPQVGCSGYRIDLGIVDPDQPGRYLLGIECDGANYHRAKTARDRDRLREDILGKLGWQLHRVWSTDWWRNPKEELSRIESAIEKARRK
jgi:very-short-patch-repair endonuclease